MVWEFLQRTRTTFSCGHWQAYRPWFFLSREILPITGVTILENGEPGKGVQSGMTFPPGAFRLLS
jgi:hypothetical protein